jgi:hypothetical protein
MELEGSLQCSQEPTTGPYPEPDESSPPVAQVVPNNPPRSEALCNFPQQADFFTVRSC